MYKITVLKDIEELDLKKNDVLYSKDDITFIFKDKVFESKGGYEMSSDITKHFSKSVLDYYIEDECLEWEGEPDEQPKEKVKEVVRYVEVPVYKYIPTYRKPSLLDWYLW